ncbi:MAG: hypothetical protein HQK75_05715 [Candidatus Magnetomorum sp.]|nr:hypothetical protein [Candidatus Magnetomorum sp.]
MKIFYITFLLLVSLGTNGFCENIHIQSIDPMPGFESVGGPAFGEPVSTYSGKGIVQYITATKIMINSKMYLVDPSSACVHQITSGEIRQSSIVSYELNELAHVSKLTLVVQLTDTGIINRITDNEVIYSDHYRALFLYVICYDITGEEINRYDLQKGDFIGLTVNKENEIDSLWKLDGHYMY